jgi:hypothetical protein
LPITNATRRPLADAGDTAKASPSDTTARIDASERCVGEIILNEVKIAKRAERAIDFLST